MVVRKIGSNRVEVLEWHRFYSTDDWSFRNRLKSDWREQLLWEWCQYTQVNLYSVRLNLPNIALHIRITIAVFWSCSCARTSRKQSSIWPSTAGIIYSNRRYLKWRKQIGFFYSFFFDFSNSLYCQLKCFVTNPKIGIHMTYEGDRITIFDGRYT